MRSCPRGFRRSVDRGEHRPAIEPRKSPILGADAVQIAEGDTSRRVIASARTTRGGQRPWHVQTLRAWELGDRLRLPAPAPLAMSGAQSDVAPPVAAPPQQLPLATEDDLR